MLKVSEVYEKQVRTLQEKPDGAQYVSFQTILDSRDCLLNPRYIVSAYAYEFLTPGEEAQSEQAFPVGTKFTRLIMDGSSFRTSPVIILGAFEKFVTLFPEHTP